MANSLHDVLLRKFSSTGINDSSDVDLKSLKFNRILSVSPNRKTICVEFCYLNEPGIIVLEKTSISHDLAEAFVGNISNSISDVKNLFRNDIYGSYFFEILFKDNQQNLNTELNKIFTSIIHPARPKDIEKYISQERFLVRETYEMYQKFTKSFIEKQRSNPNHLQWIYNVLELKSEVDRIIYKENLDSVDGFLLAKDMKWKCDVDVLSEEMKAELYLNAIVSRRDIYSLRDLKPEHLPLLENIYTKGINAISTKYLIPAQQIRVFIHYQPSFYHLHVHFTHVKGEHNGFQCERAHMLTHVIENIRLVPDYYQRVTLEYPLSPLSELKFV